MSRALHTVIPDSGELGRAVDSVIALSGAPESLRKGLRVRLKNIVLESKPPPDHEEQLERVFDEWTERRSRILDAIVELYDAAKRLKGEIEDYDRAYGRRDRMEEVAPPPMDRILREILQWATNGPFTIYEAEEGPARGRPRANVRLTHFIIILLVVIRGAGGNLNYDKNHKNDFDKSTLIRALEILRPHLGELLPDPIPVRAIMTARSIAAQGFEAYMRWDQSMPLREFTAMLRRKLQRQSGQERNKNRAV
jgi:hypothetical protein